GRLGLMSRTAVLESGELTPTTYDRGPRGRLRGHVAPRGSMFQSASGAVAPHENRFLTRGSGPCLLTTSANWHSADVSRLGRMPGSGERCGDRRPGPRLCARLC